MNLIEIGTATEMALHEGRLKLRVLAMHGGCLDGIDTVYVLGAGEQPIALHVRRIRKHSSRLTVEFDPVGAPGTVESKVFINRDRLPGTPEGEYYWVDIIGCDVEREDGTPIGKATGIMQTGGSDILVVGSGENERMIPMVGEFVKKVDVGARKIIIRPIEGLVE